MYSLYLKVNGRDIRITPLAFDHKMAVRTFQSALLDNLHWGASLKKVRQRELWSDLIILPYHGRDYKSESEILRDWEANKDFLVRGSEGTHVNKSDAIKYRKEGNGVLVVYDNRTKLCWIPFPKS